MSRYDCRDRLCGSPDCRTCYGASALRYRAQVAHEEHEDPALDMDACSECLADREAPYLEAEARYDRMREDRLTEREEW